MANKTEETKEAEVVETVEPETAFVFFDGWDEVFELDAEDNVIRSQVYKTPSEAMTGYTDTLVRIVNGGKRYENVPVRTEYPPQKVEIINEPFQPL